MKQTASIQFKEADFMHETWLQTALKALETTNLTADQRMQLELDIAYRVNYEDGLLAQGEARGEARGEAKGLARGEARGIAKKSKEIALMMLKANEPIEKIIVYSGLTKAQVLQLRG